MRLRPEDAGIGHWWASCCEEDLRQMYTQEDVDEMREWAADYAAGDGIFAGAWDTKEAALAEMATWERGELVAPGRIAWTS